MLVVEALVILPLVAKSVLTVPTVVEALLNTASPVVVRLVAVALAKVVWPATFNVPESVSPVPDAVEK